MDKKVILISIDGMRPDGLMQCGNPYVDELLKLGSYTLSAKTVFPSVTLPCHLSLFHSVPPERHGTLTNTYATPVRPVNGLFEQIKMCGGRAAMFYGWEPIRAISQPGSQVYAQFIHARSFDNTDAVLTDRALELVKTDKPDFVFLYMVETDEMGGHDNGWMSETYLKCISNAIDNVKRVVEETNGEYTIVVTADHGGHDRIHGTTMSEDMTIPMMFIGEDFEAGKDLGEISILDIVPTIADVMGVMKAPEWEGKSLVK